MALSPLTQRRLQRFKEHKRGFICLILFLVITLLSFFAEFFFNDKALMVSHKGNWYFPAFPGAKVNSGVDLGQQNDSSANYLKLQKQYKEAGEGDWVLMPMIPYSATTIDKPDRKALDAKIAVIEKKYQPQLGP